MKHFSPISGIASFQERYLATAGYDNQVILWDAQNKQALHRVYHDHLANQCSFSPNGRWLVSASSDYSARIWEVPTMRLKAALLGHEDDVEMAVFNPTSDLVATCSRDKSIRLFRVNNGQCQHVLQGHNADVISISWSMDGTTLVSSSDDGTIRRWDTIKGIEIECIDLNGVETDTIALTNDGIIFAGDDEGKLIVIDTAGKRSIQAHSAGIKRVVWNEQTKRLISLSYDRSVILWEFIGGNLKKISESSLPSLIWPRSCAFLGEERIAFVTFGSTYAVWNHHVNTWDLDGIEQAISLNSVTIYGNNTYSIGDSGTLFVNDKPNTAIGSLCNFLLPYRQKILTGGQMGQLFDAVSGELIYQHHSPLNCGTIFIRNGRQYAAIGTYTGEALIFDIDEHESVRFLEEIHLHDNAIKGLSANDKYIFSVCATAAAAFHKVDNFKLHSYIEKAHDRISNDCSSIDGGFASVGRDLKLRVWTSDKAEVYETPHQHSVKCISTSDDQKIIATGSYGGTVALFDLQKREWISKNKPTTSGISCIIYSSKEKKFIASSYDGNLYSIGISA
ncbi:WD40 repeat domain-containing protein [Xenorhabdus sp. XENO-10]|uniref:WD40 repeat domain-containing protein n=1 Tax=Xenorhabdus yunnanensis TaxID=3025878 RepID=A0ABT5LKG9_9GAMM|nr:WD40 repeat domain-containing protein [Xenorhabdus yunnanensis]MDC9590250.1 WD40 repeat domain-containing protein [Xenorhabdus yunnanensis]